MVKYLCGVAGVSRSGYYNYFSVKSQEQRRKKDKKDEGVKELILKAFHFKGRKKGARQIKMTLAGQFQVVYNLKRIRRIVKATKEHRVVPNILNRQFKQEIPGKVLLTDITYLFYGKGQKAYLSVIKDGSTSEILAHHISERMTVELATDTLLKLKRNNNFQKAKDSLIHSDQGIQYTHPNFQKAVKKLGLQQSMSRRGNCWDNAPQESFFGNLKDEASIKACTTLDELKNEIKQYMIYYNHYRYQWNLKKITPVQYREHLLRAA